MFLVFLVCITGPKFEVNKNNRKRNQAKILTWRTVKSNVKARIVKIWFVVDRGRYVLLHDNEAGK